MKPMKVNCLCQKPLSGFDRDGPTIIIKCFVDGQPFKWEYEEETETICLRTDTLDTLKFILEKKRHKYVTPKNLFSQLDYRTGQESPPVEETTYRSSGSQAGLGNIGGFGYEYDPGNLVPHSMVVVGGVLFFFGIFLCFCLELFSATNGGSLFGSRSNNNNNSSSNRRSVASRSAAAAEESLSENYLYADQDNNVMHVAINMPPQIAR